VFEGFIRRIYYSQKKPGEILLQNHKKADYSWIGSEPFLSIAHALGPKIITGSNSVATLVKGRELGFRVFEVDVALTADNVLVCYHGINEKNLNQMSYNDYLIACKSQGLSPCRFNDIVEYSKNNRDVYFVLDVKNRFYDSYRYISKAVKDNGIGKSFIPQIYEFDQIAYFRRSALFSGEIFTSYKSALTNRQIYYYARKYNIKVVTLTLQRFIEGYNEIPPDLVIFTHAVNDPIMAVDLKNKGCKGIYTSYITSKYIPELF